MADETETKAMAIASDPVAVWSSMTESVVNVWSEAAAQMMAQGFYLWSPFLHPDWQDLQVRHWQFEVPERLRQSAHPYLFA